MVLGMDDLSDIHILDIIRDKYDFPELKRAAITLNAKWRGRGLRGLYIEDKASGQSLIQELRNQSGMSVLPVKVGSDKVSRLNAVLPLVEGGRVYLPNEALWLDAFMEEAQSFPSGKHDDQIDALSMGLEAIAKMGGAASELMNGPINMASSLSSQFQQAENNKQWWAADLKVQPQFKGWGEL
jgi:predicted phage terminase large subunit-like protein